MDFHKSQYKLAISAAVADHLSCIYCCTLLSVNDPITQELFGCMCTQTNEVMCTYYFLLCVQLQHTTAITHSHTHTHTHTDGPRAALAVVD